MSNDILNLSQVSLYNTQRVTDEQSRLLFCVRTNLFDQIIDSIRSSRSDAPPQHHLILGQRGMGKTTLLKRLEVELRSTPLQCAFIPLLFPEEQYNLDSLNTFWLNCLDTLADVLEKEGREEDVQEIDHEVEHLSTLTPEDGSNRAYSFFRHIVFNLQRRPVLLIDNINFVLNRLSEEDQHTLRSLMTEENAPIIIGASSSQVNEANSYAAPFYDAFKVHYLKRLTDKELTEILNNLATITGQPSLKKDIREKTPRLKALNQLTGGNPRTAVILFKQAIKGFSNDITGDLDGILDDLTPLYKSRFEELPEKMQLIVNAIAMQWDPITLEQIRRSTQMENGQISPQLTRLSDAGWIEKPKSARGKGGRYEVSERMFNIWFLMRRSSRRHKKMVACLSKFMEAFYEKGSELSEMLKEIMLKQFTDVKHAVTALALAKLTEDKTARWELHAKTRQFIIEHPELSDSFEIKDLYDGAEEHADALTNAIRSNDAPAIIYYAMPAYKAGATLFAPFLTQALIETNRLSEAKEVIKDISSAEHKYHLLIELAVAIHDNDSYSSSAIEECCIEAISCGNYDSDAYFFYAQFFLENERYNEALKLLTTANSIFPEDPRLLGATASAFYFLGDNDNAESILTSPVLSKEGDPGLINYYLGTIRYGQGRYSEAIDILSREQDSQSVSVLSTRIWLIPALYFDGRITESRDLFNKTLGLIDSPGDIAKVLSQLFSKEQKYDILLEYLLVMRDHWPNVSILNLYIAECYYYQDSLTDAVQFLDPYLHESPTDSDALFLRGLIAWLGNESYELAKAYVQKSADIKEGRIKRHALGLIEQSHANYIAAAEQFEKAVSLDPQDNFSMIQLSEICEYHLSQIERARSLAEQAHEIDRSESPYRLVNLYRDGLFEYDLANDCIRDIPEDSRCPGWEAVHQILTAIHLGNWSAAKSELQAFFSRPDTDEVDRDFRCYLYAKCIEFGHGPVLLDYLEEFGIKESASPEYFAVQALLSDDPTAFFDSVAKETREIGLSIAHDIKYYIKE